jgi:hypothetical protein
MINEQCEMIWRFAPWYIDTVADLVLALRQPMRASVQATYQHKVFFVFQ